MLSVWEPTPNRPQFPSSVIFTQVVCFIVFVLMLGHHKSSLLVQWHFINGRKILFIDSFSGIVLSLETFLKLWHCSPLPPTIFFPPIIFSVCITYRDLPLTSVHACLWKNPIHSTVTGYPGVFIFGWSLSPFKALTECNNCFQNPGETFQYTLPRVCF